MAATGTPSSPAGHGAVANGATDAQLSSVGGLVSFNAFTRGHELHRELRRRFGRLKTGRDVVYPMAAQVQLLLDPWVAGAQRVLDVEMLAVDPLFVHLAGGTVPSIAVFYDDLRRFDPQALEDLEELMAQHGRDLLKDRRHEEIFVHSDTTVMPLFGEQEGGPPRSQPALPRAPPLPSDPGPYRADWHRAGRAVASRRYDLGRTRYRGRRAVARPRTRSRRTAHAHHRPQRRRGRLRVAPARHRPQGRLVSRQTQVDSQPGRRRLGDPRVDHRRSRRLGQPVCQFAEVDFLREDWAPDWRVFAVRSSERRSGHQTGLWEDLDYSVHFYVAHDADDLARRYDGRAGIEPIIAELKDGLAIGKVSTEAFDANEAAFLLKLLAFNLLRRWVRVQPVAIRHWRVSWIRRVCVQVPARLLRAGGRWQLRLAPRPMLT